MIGASPLSDKVGEPRPLLPYQTIQSLIWMLSTANPK